jgi:hypothetical protein
MSDPSSVLDEAIDAGDVAVVRSVLESGARLDERQWVLLVDPNAVGMLRVAMELSGVPPVKAVGGALVMAANGGQIGTHAEEDAAGLCRAITDGADTLGREFASALATRHGPGAIRHARQTFRAPADSDTPADQTPRVVAELVRWVDERTGQAQ